MMPNICDSCQLIIVGVLWLVSSGFSLAGERPPQRLTEPVRVTEFLPTGFATDGSVSYQRQIQQAIDRAAKGSGQLVFPPMIYRLDEPQGLQLHSHMTLAMYGATILLSERCSSDGQAFFGQNVTDLRLLGGRIRGRNDRWPAGVNIRGVLLSGQCKRIRIRDMQMDGLSSNGIGVFGRDTEHPAEDVWIADTIIDNCCNTYADYQVAPPARPGPEEGSVREDQGLIAMYYVHGFTVRGCRLEDSRSDATHFYFCQDGQFVDNRVYRAKMGGYFVESCRHILAANNVIRHSGSRGVTIERGSRCCTLIGNTIQGSGREGLWIPDSISCTITGNVFTLNGRKTNGQQRHEIWNANITINQARGDKLHTPTANYVIADNIIETDLHQIAAIRVDTREEIRNIVIQRNLLIGDNRRILIEGPNQDAVSADDNRGAEVLRQDDKSQH